MRLGLDVNLKISFDDKAPSWAIEMQAALASIVDKMGRIERKEDILKMKIEDIQAKADETLAKVTADADVSNAVKTVVLHQNDTLTALQAQIAELLASNDPAALQKLSDTIDAIKATETANAQVVADAVTAGTPVETPPVPVPTPDAP